MNRRASDPPTAPKQETSLRTVQLFAGASEAAGCDSIEVRLGRAVSAAEVLQAIARSHPELSALLPTCRLVADQTYMAADSIIAPEAELALIPPVSGG